MVDTCLPPGRLFGRFRLAQLAVLPDRDHQQPEPEGELGCDCRQRGSSAGLRGVVAGDEHRDRNHDRERNQPAEDERGTLPHAALRREDQDERSERDRLERDRQADENQAKDEHVSPDLLAVQHRGAPPARNWLPRPGSTASMYPLAVTTADAAGRVDSPARRHCQYAHPIAPGCSPAPPGQDQPLRLAGR
jgi:hypothetical protein